MSEEKKITRRDAIKTMGVAAAATVVCASGASALASCVPQTNGKMKDMKVLLLNGSPRPNGNTATMLKEVASQYWNIGYGAGEGEVSQDAEGLQTMRTLADNMAYMLRQFATGDAEKPEREPWTTTNFIR